MSRRRNRWTGMIHVAPALIFVAVFVLWPLSHPLWLSLTAKSLMSGPNDPVAFVGFDNYARALGDKKFWRVMTFTLTYTAYITPILLILNLALALLVFKNTFLRRVTRTVVFLPVVIGLASSSLLWYWLFDHEVGLFNQLLVDLQVMSEPLVWFKKAVTGQFAVIISAVWKVLGFGMILMVAGVQALLISLYLLLNDLGLMATKPGLAVLHTILQLPFSIYLMRTGFEAVPKEMEEAAVVDGATSFFALRRIFLPLVAPGVVTVALFAFITSWNEFIGALILMNHEDSFTVPILMTGIMTGNIGAINWGGLQASVIISILPCMIVYLLLQRYYISGLLSGAVK